MYGSFVRSVRTSRAMTQAQVAANAGITQSNLSAIENDRRLPTIDTLNRIVVACGYELAAVAGNRTIYAPIGDNPEDATPRLPGDPPDEAPVVGRGTPMEARVNVINGLLGIR